MKILLVGLGSIGKRHLRNLLSLGYNDIHIVSRSGILPEEFSSYQVYNNIDKALTNTFYDVAIVCVPTAMHVPVMESLIDAKVPAIYLEKPVSHTFENIEELLLQLQKINTRVIIGFDMHYDLGLLKVKELLDQDAIGKLVSVNAQVGQYLPDWRPHEDYRIGMSAKTETGGGVMLDLVHEFDYLYWLIGKVDAIASFNLNSGSLEIATEDVAEVLLKFNNGVVGTIHLDYLQQKLVRNCLFTGSNGSILWNLAESKVNWIDQHKMQHEFSYSGFERNDRFVNIMQSFMENKEDARLTSFNDGLQSLKMVLAAKYSSNHNVFVQMDQFNP